MSATGRKFPERRSETSCRPRRDGEEAAFALGLSIARPDGLIILDVDEASLSNLGVLVTIFDAAPKNLVHVLFRSGVRSGKAAGILNESGPTMLVINVDPFSGGVPRALHAIMT